MRPICPTLRPKSQLQLLSFPFLLVPNPHVSTRQGLTRYPNSQISHDRRAAHLHGVDRLLQDINTTADAPTAEYAEIRPCRYVVHTETSGGRRSDGRETIEIAIEETGTELTCRYL